MGVTGLWTVLQPCARPIKIETLNKKRLAVDASIWIYQFLKAVRDKEGNALRNSHIVGFFRRICKLLFFGIKPVFVFDGGAPALKRQTINNRKSRREGRREDAVRTAGKLLALQLQRVAEEEERKRKDKGSRSNAEQEEDIPENVVYAEEILHTEKERQQNRKFKKKDQYHLPDLGVSMAEMGGANDPRIMSLEELEEYARHFDTGEDINVYDFSKIDFDSPFFVSLPASDRYNILNAARLRSRLRMGYSKEQLDIMFPDRMAFSKFQIDRVRERNDLTQRLMNLNGMNDDTMFGPNAANRVAGEKGREYVLVKNDGVEGGWALGVVTNKDEGKINKPIDVDRLPLPDADDDDWEEDDDFEDVPIEGLNRLPKAKPKPTAEEEEGRDFIAKELAERRRRLYNSRRQKPAKPKPRKKVLVNQDPDSLFLAENDEVMAEVEEDNDEQEWESVALGANDDLFEEPGEQVDEEQQALQKAIALSLQPDGQESAEASEEEEDIYREVFQQERVPESRPFAQAKGAGLAAIARTANQQSRKLVPKTPFNDSDSDDDMDLQAALAESRKSKRPTTAIRPLQKAQNNAPLPPRAAPKSTNAPGFDGPLPFEKLSLGNSLLGKKKMQKIEEANAGGFDKDQGSEKKKAAEPPPWFSGDRDIQEELTTQREDERKDWEEARKADEARYQFQSIPTLRKQHTREIIDLEAASTQEKTKEIVAIDSSEDEEDMEMEDVVIDKATPTMGDLADKIRAEPPQPLSEAKILPSRQEVPAPTRNPFAEDSDDEPIDWSESEPDVERTARLASKPNQGADKVITQTSKSPSPEFEDVPLQTEPPPTLQPAKSPSPDFEDVPMQTEPPPTSQPAKSPSPEFEDVPMRMGPPSRPRPESPPVLLEGPANLSKPIVPSSEIPEDDVAFENGDNDSDQYSDPEDAELFASLAAEAEEHSRFAHEINSNSKPINFDAEMKQLRAQQKKDRRDADEVTQTMISECQHLLTLFGLPYVTAPMEAEAQCAELVSLGLVDGIVTDDSDTFLFGGTRVYKNMFNAAKFVECYLANDFNSEFSLTRDKLIAIAQLLGSDYTTGIPGIGPVTALEILSEFSDLQTFKDWWTGVQNGTVPKDADKSSQFRRRFRRTQAAKLFLPTNFPDPRVAQAYQEPDVDKDPQPFQWGVPDLDALRNFLSSQIGWSWERTDEVLVPVIKDMNRREKEGTQSNITRFFDGAVGAGAFAPRVRDGGQGGPSGNRKGKGAAGKRLGAALTRLAEKDKESRGEGEEAGNGDVDVVGNDAATSEIEAAPTARIAKRKPRNSVRNAAAAPEENLDGEDEEDDDDDLYADPRPKKKTRKTRKGKVAA
jgi:DNA excision repair protein ERCC-5